MANHTANHTELVSGRLHVVGANLPMDGKASWTPPKASGFQPINCYAIIDSDRSAIVIDPGPACVEDAVLGGLRPLVGNGAPVAAFISRAQLDVVGNLGALTPALHLESLNTGGAPIVVDSYSAVPSADIQGRAINLPLKRLGKVGSVPVGGSRLMIVDPPLRILTTYWSYDEESRTLFTSDSFSHAVLDDPDAEPVVDDLDADQTSPSDVRAHLLSSFWWLEYADTRPIVERLRRTIDQYDVELIAPGHGCVLKGRDVVGRHVEMVIDVLDKLRKTRV